MNSIEQFEMLCASIVSLFMIIFNFRILYIKKNCLKEVIILDDIFLALLGFVIFMGILVAFVGTQVL